MRESSVERYLKTRVKEEGGDVRKVKWIGRRNAPDRLVLFNWFAAFVELKAPGKKPTVPQLREHRSLRYAGLSVYVIDGFKGVDHLIERAKQ